MTKRDFISSLTLALALSSGMLYGFFNKPGNAPSPSAQPGAEAGMPPAPTGANEKESESIRSRPRNASRFDAALRELLPRLGFKIPAIGEEGR